MEKARSAAADDGVRVNTSCASDVLFVLCSVCRECCVSSLCAVLVINCAMLCLCCVCSLQCACCMCSVCRECCMCARDACADCAYSALFLHFQHSSILHLILQGHLSQQTMTMVQQTLTMLKLKTMRKMRLVLVRTCRPTLSFEFNNAETP